MKQLTAILAVTLLLTGGCQKKDDPVTPVVDNTPKNALKVSIKNMAGNEPLALNSNWYQTANGDSLQVKVFSYFISNIKLTTADGKVYNEPESYHYVSESLPGTKSFLMTNLPEGSYTSITFMIGVDSEKNVSGAQNGDLSPTTGMFWDWNTGYIMAKLEGTSPQSDGYLGMVLMHTGGYKQPYNALRTVTLNAPINISKGTLTLHLKADVLEWFKTPHLIDLKQLYLFNTDCADAVTIADNYADMITVDYVD